ncbi:MAG: ABC transporter ATP-binding protein [Clostridium sp.]|nr:ABC transporter ATP-binding protein [Clostridium sp.]
MIKLEHIYFSYNDIYALKDISLTINNDESIALKGPNGCGKSTLLKLLNGIIFPTKGDYFFDNYHITKETMKDNKFSKWLHQKIGFVFQNPDTQLFCGNVYEEIAFGPRQMGFSEDIVSKRTEDCLKLLEINHLKNRAPYHLSGGEKRKVAIASVLSLNPSILMLDEPLNGLDSDSQEWLVNFLIDLRNSHKTILLSTHDQAFAHTVCDKSIEINKNHELVDVSYFSYKRIKEV